jgi:acetoin utilization deacetylase AcuC-like enzyme
MSQTNRPTCYMSELFGEHDPGRGHPERPERYAAVAAAVGAVGCPVEDAPPAGPEALERVHAEPYLELLERFCIAGGGALDPDTVVTGVSWRAALRAAGGAMAAVDVAAADRSRSAFSLGRPPGHHAEPSRAMGFCILNSAAVAAAHARHDLGMDRVAILDWDAHHGNGTQAAFYEDGSVLYVSLHQYPFYPGTGAANERGDGAGQGATVNLPLPAGTTEAEFLAAFRDHAVPSVERFGPDLVIVSAGFDAHRDDPLCALGLGSEGLGVMASELRDRFGGLALVLEGGYDLGALETSVAAVLTALAA